MELSVTNETPRVLRRLSLILFAALAAAAPARAGGKDPVSVLIVVEGGTSMSSPAIARGRELATLLGHFNAAARVLGVNEYVPRTFGRYDLVFFIGFNAVYAPPARFCDDVLASTTPVIWIDTGFREFSRRPEVRKKYGFTVSHIDSLSRFDEVRAGDMTFTKGEPNLNMIEIADRRKVTVTATAVSSGKHWEVPYIVRAGNLMYFADCPFASSTETDRYLLFADMLHDLLRQPHETAHTALIRIEDVNPLEDPARLRMIADVLATRNIPFMVGVIPFYVSRSEGITVSLSDRPDLVDALKYMVQSGGTIVMHGVTHQYRGTTAVDYEFWDETTNRPIREETVESIQRKLDTGIQEFMKNGLYPLVWETPHYTASTKLYETVSRYFSTAMEQRLSIEDADAGQYFPYVINRDLYGQRLIPENLGYVPLDPDPAVGEAAVKRIIAAARVNLAVRDGFAASFFHAFVDPALLAEIVDGVRALGYTYRDVKEFPSWVRTKDRIILCGSQDYTITLDDQYLQETTFDRNGEIVATATSEKRLKGPVTRRVSLEPGQFYTAGPVEFREKSPSLAERVLGGATRMLDRLTGQEESWREARAAILWNQFAGGAAFNDQASFAGVMRSVNIALDTLFVGQPVRTAGINLLLVPYAFVDSLRDEDYDAITRFVREGGNVVTDMPTELAQELGIVSGGTRLRVTRVRDRLYPDERIVWPYAELATKFDAEGIDNVFCVDEETEAPLAVGKSFGKGKVLYFSTRFDPRSREGYSLYPYLLEYIGRYFRLGPVVRRDRLEVYFEPGSRARTMSTEALIRHWVRLGVGALHVSGWHQWSKYTYDYGRLIALAHANGILVYAWLEPPQVSQKFWTDHPSWREKTIDDDDARASWRYPVALTDTACLRSMEEEYRTLLEQFDWDGVNLAELYFDSGRGFLDPRLFTPMHPSALRDFRRRYGFDMDEVFDTASTNYWQKSPGARRAVADYRVEVLDGVYRRLLGMLGTVAASRPGFQVIVTAMDSYSAPELREYLGVDMASVLALQKQYGFTLQVEDPERMWATKPAREEEIGERYAALLGGRAHLMLDLNVVSVRKPDQVTPFPTLIQTGTESVQLVRHASLGAPRLTIYSESSVNPQDIKFFPFALASDVSCRRTAAGYAVSSPGSFTLKLPPEVRVIRVDGALHAPSRENAFLIPAGNHTIDAGEEGSPAFSTHELEARILSFTGNLLSFSQGLRSVSFAYESETRALVALNREPTAVAIDGETVACTALRGNDCFTVALPPGRHSARLAVGNVVSTGVNLTSFWSSNAIAVFGACAVLLLVGMYVTLKLVRRHYA